MREFSGFFNSIDGDERFYDDSGMNKPMAYLLTNGVYAGENVLMVEPGPAALTVQLWPGMAVIEGRWYGAEPDPGVEDDRIVLYLQQAISNPYIARIVVRSDQTEAVGGRHIRPTVIVGAEALEPVPPNIVREGDIYDICLAEVTVYPGGGLIPAENIKDTRFDYALCGIVDFAPNPIIEPMMVQGFVQGYVYRDITLLPGLWEPVDLERFPEHQGEVMQIFPPMSEPPSPYIFSDSFGVFNQAYIQIKRGYPGPNDVVNALGRAAFFMNVTPDFPVVGDAFFQRGGFPVNEFR